MVSCIQHNKDELLGLLYPSNVAGAYQSEQSYLLQAQNTYKEGKRTTFNAKQSRKIMNLLKTLFKKKWPRPAFSSPKIDF